MRQPETHSLRDNQQGFASIVIALVLIVILALVTVGFAQLARREQQNALDKQLSTQAYYAAETGVNDAHQDILSGALYNNVATGGTTDTSTTTCMTKNGSAGVDPLPTAPNANSPVAALTANPAVNAADGVSYSCLLVDLTPNSLNFGDGSAGVGQYQVFSITGAVPLGSLTIQWGSHDGHTTYPTTATYPAGAQLPSLASWNALNYPPLLQVSLTPTNSGGAFTRANLIDNTFSAYLYPSSGGSGSVAENLAQQGQIVSGNCIATNPHPCSVTITSSGPTGLGGTSFLLHYLNFYDYVDVHITGTNVNGGPVNFIGQAQVDVTGKAQNVLKRLQVTLNTSGNTASLPDDAAAAQNICKRLQTAPVNASTNPNGTNFQNPDTSNATTAPCDLELYP